MNEHEYSIGQAGETRRISKSRSRFDAAGKHFLLVYKTEEGGYSRPIELPLDQALRLAKTYSRTKTVPADSPVEASVAKHILRRALADGLMASTTSNTAAPLSGSTRNSLANDATASGSRRPKNSDGELNATPSSVALREPEFLSHINSTEELSADVLDTLAFILSGIDPELRTDPQTLSANLRLKDLACTPSSRIAVDTLLHADHWYVLAHLHSKPESEFRQLWEEAKTQKKGQQGTDIQRIATKFEKFQLDPAEKQLSDVRNQAIFLSIREYSVDILVRIYQRARRRIHAAHEEPEAKPRTDWLTKLGLRRQTQLEAPTTVEVADNVRDLVREYVAQCVKLGRILRSSVIKAQDLRDSS
jgi:hypothetical protein